MRKILLVLIAATACGQTPHYVTLKWTASATADSAYNVYRVEGACPGGTFVKIGNVAAHIVTYDDRTVVAGKSYCYYTTATKEGVTESAASNKVSAVIPQDTAAPPTGLTSVVPKIASVPLKGTVQFSANGNATPQWGINPIVGTISPTGLYTAPDKIQGKEQEITVIASSKTTSEKAQARLTIVKK